MFEGQVAKRFLNSIYYVCSATIWETLTRRNGKKRLVRKFGHPLIRRVANKKQRRKHQNNVLTLQSVAKNRRNSLHWNRPVHSKRQLLKEVYTYGDSKSRLGLKDYVADGPCMTKNFWLWIRIVSNYNPMVGFFKKINILNCSHSIFLIFPGLKR